MSKIERFQLVDEEGIIHDAMKITPIERIRGSNELMMKLPSFQLATGEHINPSGDGFEAIFSGLKLARLPEDSRNAPGLPHATRDC